MSHFKVAALGALMYASCATATPQGPVLLVPHARNDAADTISDASGPPPRAAATTRSPGGPIDSSPPFAGDAQAFAAVQHAIAIANLSDRAGGSSSSPHGLATGERLVDGADARFVDVVSDQGQRAHGLYFTAFMTRRLGAQGIIKAVRSAGLDAAVIDLKDQSGRVNYDTRIEALAEERQVLIRDLPGLLQQLKAAGIYSIGRIVCFSDPVLPRLHPELAVMDSRPNRAGEIWNKRGTNTWLDPYNPKNHDLVVAIAVEAEALGFDEVQLDYIRFPVDDGTKFAKFPAQGDALRRDVLLGLLRRVDEAIHIPLGVDVFGLTTIRAGDPAGLGQSLEDWAKYVEVFTPMLYVNGMKTWLRHKNEGRAGLLVEVEVRALRERVGPAPVIRPFLQAFERGADYYNGAFIAEQIQGARGGGGDGFLFWHPASTYGMVREGMASGLRGQVPFSISDRRGARMRSWGQIESEPQATLQPPTPSGG
jgi:hypothetical protein